MASGRTRLYDLIGRGAIRAVKSGSATLIDLESVEAWAVSLPQAEIAPQRRREAA